MNAPYIEIILAFSVILGLLLVFYGFLQRRRAGEMGLINILAYRVIDQRRGVAIAVMKIGDELLYIGITPSEMKVLKRVPDRITSDTESRLRLIREMKKRVNEDN